MPPAQRALIEVAQRLTSYPWTVDAETMRPLRTVAGLGEAAALQVVTIVSRFNYLTRVANATDIEVDYGGTLSPFRRSAEPLSADARTADTAGAAGAGTAGSAGSAGSGAWQETLRRLGDDVVERYLALHDYVLAREAPLTADVRSRLALVAAEAAGDDAWAAELADAATTPTDQVARDFAEKLAARPAEMAEDDVGSLRALGYDDRTILDVISGVAFAAAHARLRLGLAAALAGAPAEAPAAG